MTEINFSHGVASCFVSTDCNWATPSTLSAMHLTGVRPVRWWSAPWRSWTLTPRSSAIYQRSTPACPSTSSSRLSCSALGLYCADTSRGEPTSLPALRPKDWATLCPCSHSRRCCSRTWCCWTLITSSGHFSGPSSWPKRACLSSCASSRWWCPARTAGTARQGSSQSSPPRATTSPWVILSVS